MTAPSERLNGWKDIASHLGKGLRTAQRWEKVYGLPVHRIGKGRGEHVHAYAGEIDAWLQTAAAPAAVADEPSPDTTKNRPDAPDVASTEAVEPGSVEDEANDLPRPGRSLRVRPWLRAILLTSVGALLGWTLHDAMDVHLARSAAPGSGAREPASFRVEGNALTVFDGTEHVLFTCRFPFRLAEPRYENLTLTAAESVDDVRLVSFRDLTGDGKQQVLFVAIDMSHPERATLYAFEPDGSVRFTYARSGQVTFGETVFAGPFPVSGFRTLREADGTRSIWVVSSHGRLFPSSVQKLNSLGRPQSDYWSNGPITSITAGTWQGQRVIVFGGQNSEHRGAALAMLDAARPTGSAPAATDHYRCTDCPSGAPVAMVVFPVAPRLLSVGGAATIGRITFRESSQLEVEVRHSVGTSPSTATATALYFLDRALRPVALELGDTWDPVLAQLNDKDLLTDTTSIEPKQELLPVLQWDGSTFVKVDLQTSND